MEVIELIDNPDGSADVLFDITEEESEILINKGLTDILKEQFDLEEHLISITDAQEEIFKWCYAHYQGLTSIDELDDDSDFYYWKDFIRSIMCDNKHMKDDIKKRIT